MKEIDASQTIAYVSMEIGLKSNLPTYSGGLGMLAGDTIRSSADMGIPLVAVTLLHRKGYFTQRIDVADGTRRPGARRTRDLRYEGVVKNFHR